MRRRSTRQVFLTCGVCDRKLLLHARGEIPPEDAQFRAIDWLYLDGSPTHDDDPVPVCCVWGFRILVEMTA